MFVIDNLSFALLGGVLPALLWLWFWLREDKLHPEPRLRLITCFIAGMLAVPVVYNIQKFTCDTLSSCNALSSFAGLTPTIFMTIVIWAAIEEIAKYAAAGVSAFRSKDFDEPIDGLVYMITAALGFAAIENVFFILSSLMGGGILGGITTMGTRFIGASLLHVTSSAILGFFIGKSFYSKIWKKVTARLLGVTVAVVLHSVFNLFIITSDDGKTFWAFGMVWIVTFVLLFLFERVKKLQQLDMKKIL